MFFSFVSMLICTNDGFTGLDSKELPNRVGDQLVFEMPGSSIRRDGARHGENQYGKKLVARAIHDGSP